MTAAKDGVLVRRRLRIFAAAAALVLLCAVCVGGVSGAELHVSATASSEDGWYTSLAEAVVAANDGDIIIIEDAEYTITEQVTLSPETEADKKTITIINKPGVHVTINSGLTADAVDDRTLFIITGGTLIVKGDSEGGSLTITTNYNGRAFDVNYDYTYYWWPYSSDGIDSMLIMEDNVEIIKCGFNYDGDDDGGAVYVRTDGEFVMNGGGLLYNIAGAGGAVIVDGGTFTINGGLVYGNKALDTNSGSVGGGGVYITHSSGTCNLMGGVIYGNSAEMEGEEYQQVYGGSYNKAKPWISHDGDICEFYTISEAYSAEASFAGKIYLHADITQTPGEHIVVDKALTILPAKTDVKLVITESSATGGMFEVTSGGSLTFQKSEINDYSLTVSGSNNLEGNGGAVYVNGGSFTISDGVLLSGLHAENGGAIYLNGGTCTLAGSAIQDCLASGLGSAVYVAGGTFTVQDSAYVDASNDVYLASGQVITAESCYSGSVGKITLPSYADGTKVVDTGSDSSGYSGQFTLNQDGNEGIERVLDLDTSDIPNYLVVKNKVEYTVTIPPSLVISEESNTGFMEISVSGLNILPSTALKVYVEGDFTLEHQTSQNEQRTLSYELRTGEDTVLSSGGYVGQFTMGNQNPIQLTARVPPGQASYAGIYTDTLTFTYGPPEVIV